jgi:hypothetical protein
MPKPEDDPNFIGPIKPPSVGQNIMTGLNSALKFLNTGQGGQLMGYLAKNPEVKAQIVAQSRAKIPSDQAAESEANKIEMEKTKSIGDLLAQQSAIEQQNKVLERTLGAKQEEAVAEKQIKEEERKQKLTDDILKTSIDEKMSTIDKSGLSTDEKLTAKQMIMKGMDPKTEKSFWGNISFGMLGSKEKLGKKQQEIVMDAQGNKAIKNPDGTYTEIQ